MTDIQAKIFFFLNYFPKVGFKSIFNHVGKRPDFYTCSFRAGDPVKYLTTWAVYALHAKEQFPEEIPRLEANKKLFKYTTGFCHPSLVSSTDHRMCPCIGNVGSAHGDVHVQSLDAQNC